MRKKFAYGIVYLNSPQHVRAHGGESLTFYYTTLPPICQAFLLKNFAQNLPKTALIFCQKCRSANCIKKEGY